MRKYFLFLSFFVLFPFFASAQTGTLDPEATSISILPSEPAVNQPVTITVKCKNDGTDTISSYSGSDYTKTFRNFYQESNQGNDLTSIAPGGVFSFVFTGYFTEAGNSSLRFTLQPDFSDNRTGNNSADLDITVVPAYDFYVEDIEITPKNPMPEQDAQITIKVKNNGFAGLRDGSGWNSVLYSFPNFEIESDTMPVIDSSNRVESGEYFYYYYYGQFNEIGSHNLEFTIDKSDQVEEKSESNNYKQKTITVYDKSTADLSVEGLSFNIDKPIKGQAGKITATVKNTGKVSLIDKVGFLYEDDTLVYPRILSELDYEFEGFDITSIEYPDYPSSSNHFDPGEIIYYVFNGSFSKSGARLMNFNFNTNRRLIESDWNNNAKAGAVTVYADATERDEFEIENFRAEVESEEAINLYWNISKKLASTLYYRLNNYTSWKEVSLTANTANSQRINNLKPGFQYYFKVTSSHETVLRTSDILKIKMPIGNGLTLEEGPTSVNSFGDNFTLVSFKTNLQSQGSLKYREKSTEDYTTLDLGDAKISHNIKITDLKNGNYEYYLELKSIPGTTQTTGLDEFLISGLEEEEAGESETEAEEGAEEEAASETETTEEEIAPEAPEESVPSEASVADIGNAEMYNNLKGKIVLTVEQNGEAYYLHPTKQKRYFLGRPEDAFQVMRDQGVGINNANLEQIPIGLTDASGIDSDSDGLSDLLEDAIGTDKNKKDTDSDGYEDRVEVTQNFNPIGEGRDKSRAGFSDPHKGKIFLQVEGAGEAWYVSPSNGKRYFLGRPGDAFSVMRSLGLGISDENFDNL